MCLADAVRSSMDFAADPAAPPLRRMSMYFAHVHKAAGGSVCQLARFNAYTANYARNCELPTEHERRTLSQGNLSMQCSLLRKLHRRMRTFVANEHSLPDSMYWSSDYVYATVVREPMRRYLSNYGHVYNLLRAGKRASEYDAFVTIKRAYPNRREPPPLSAFLSLDGSSGFKDNFLTRHFAGASSMAKAEGGLSETDLKRAMCRLLRFDLVVLLEPGEFPEVLRDALGWWLKSARLVPCQNCTSLQLSLTGHNSSSQLSNLKSVDADTLALLRNKSHFDTRLYHFAGKVMEAARRAKLAGQPWPLPRWRVTTANSSSEPLGDDARALRVDDAECDSVLQQDGHRLRECM